jgi:hypothetical protein
MTTEINKYHTSKIYKLSSPQCEKFYIGSTTRTLNVRLTQHKSDYKIYLEKSIGSYLTSFEVVKFDDCIIELIKGVKCESKKELDRIEGECILEHHDRILNKNVAGRTLKEWYQINKGKIKEYYEAHKNEIKDKQKEYCKAHKNELKEKAKEYYEAHKNELRDKHKEYRETHKNELTDKKKEYYEAHKNEIKEKAKEYYEANKDKRIEKAKEYYEANKDKRKEKLTEKINCDCGGKYIKLNKTNHNKTQRHIDFLSSAS